MDLEMVLNELSIKTPADNIHTARYWMSELIDTVRAASEAGVRRALRTHIDINFTVLADDYPLVRWRNDNDVDLEARRYFRLLVTQYPPLTDLPKLENEILAQDFFYMGDQASGLGVAYLLEGLAISFFSEPKWDSNTIRGIDRQWLEDDVNLLTDTIQVHHASRSQHILELSEWIRDRLRTAIQSGENLWNRRNELFPSLIFCENIKRQVCNLHAGNPLLRQIIKRLFEIDNYCRGWEIGPFDPDNLPFKATGENEATMNKYEKERTFNCPNNGEIAFVWHGRITPGAWRIYFDPSPGPGRMYIGYIGPKLPSVDYPT